MKIVIVGCGKVGYALAAQLSAENHDITVVDNNSRVIEKAQETLDVMSMSGNGAALAIQQEARVGEADLLIATTSSDELNLLCCIVAKRLGCRHTISRVRNTDYMNQLTFMRDDFGLSMTVNPEYATARTIWRFLQFPSFLKIDSFAKGRVELVELKITENSVLNGKSLDKLSTELHLKVLVCVVERDNQIFIPKGDFVLREGDKINVTAPRSELTKMIKTLGISTQKIRNVMVVGGGRIAEYLAEELIRSGVDVKIIERDRERSIELASRYPEALIINDDGSIHDVLMAEGIRETDAVVTLTGIDEQNLVISLYAGHIGVPKTITKLNRSEYSELFSDRELGSTVCPKEVIASEIIRYVRSIDNSDASIITLHRIVDGKAEAIEFIANAQTTGLDIPLKDLKLKKNILIACINHDGKIIIPRGMDRISYGDTVIIVTAADEPISELNDIFEDNN
ncbi:MAG: Trk system potassium transporter TrkA [Clostridia bacterium]|nr:Trk system potassium transporter TrkA [Clostridia bacterium]